MCVMGQVTDCVKISYNCAAQLYFLSDVVRVSMMYHRNRVFCRAKYGRVMPLEFPYDRVQNEPLQWIRISTFRVSGCMF